MAIVKMFIKLIGWFTMCYCAGAGAGYYTRDAIEKKNRVETVFGMLMCVVTIATSYWAGRILGAAAYDEAIEDMNMEEDKEA